MLTAIFFFFLAPTLLRLQKGSETDKDCMYSQGQLPIYTHMLYTSFYIL